MYAEQTGDFGSQAVSAGGNSVIADDKWPERCKEIPNLNLAPAPTPGSPFPIMLFF